MIEAGNSPQTSDVLSVATLRWCVWLDSNPRLCLAFQKKVGLIHPEHVEHHRYAASARCIQCSAAWPVGNVFPRVLYAGTIASAGQDLSTRLGRNTGIPVALTKDTIQGCLPENWHANHVTRRKFQYCCRRCLGLICDKRTPLS